MKIYSGECKRELPETEEFFYFRKETGNFRSECKDCFNKKKKIYRDNHLDYISNFRKKYYKNILGKEHY